MLLVSKRCSRYVTAFERLLICWWIHLMWGTTSRPTFTVRRIYIVKFGQCRTRACVSFWNTEAGSRWTHVRVVRVLIQIWNCMIPWVCSCCKVFCCSLNYDWHRFIMGQLKQLLRGFRLLNFNRLLWEKKVPFQRRGTFNMVPLLLWCLSDDIFISLYQWRWL